MTLEAYKKNIGSASKAPSEDDPFPDKKSTLFLLRDKTIECNALYFKVRSFEALERRLACSPFGEKEQKSKIETAKRENEEAERYFSEDDIIESSDMEETLVLVKSRLFELY